MADRFNLKPALPQLHCHFKKCFDHSEMLIHNFDKPSVDPLHFSVGAHVYKRKPLLNQEL